MQTIKENLFSLEFDSWDYTDLQLVEIAAEILLDFFKSINFEASRQSTVTFLYKVKNHYKDNPFHNFRHVVDVTQFCYVLLKNNETAKNFNDLEKLALIITCICHDLEHPGTTNLFQRTYKTSQYSEFGAEATLEKLHSSVSKQLLLSEDIDLFDTLSHEEKDSLVKLVDVFILSTDMDQHNHYMELAKNHSKADNILRGQILIKCCDLCNLLRSNKVAQKWANALADELCLQGDIEQEKGVEELGFPLSRDHRIDTVNAQLFFLEKIVIPLYRTYCNMFDNQKELIEILNKKFDYFNSKK